MWHCRSRYTAYLKCTENLLRLLDSLILIQVPVRLTDIALQPVGVNVCRLQAFLTSLLSCLNIGASSHLTRWQHCVWVIINVLIVWVLQVY